MKAPLHLLHLFISSARRGSLNLLRVSSHLLLYTTTESSCDYLELCSKTRNDSQHYKSRGGDWLAMTSLDLHTENWKLKNKLISYQIHELYEQNLTVRTGYGYSANKMYFLESSILTSVLENNFPDLSSLRIVTNCFWSLHFQKPPMRAYYSHTLYVPLGFGYTVHGLGTRLACFSVLVLLCRCRELGRLHKTSDEESCFRPQVMAFSME